jgi:hypothetical protein
MDCIGVGWMTRSINRLRHQLGTLLVLGSQLSVLSLAWGSVLVLGSLGSVFPRNIYLL